MNRFVKYCIGFLIISILLGAALHHLDLGSFMRKIHGG